MSNANAKINRFVWCDIPVSNLERANAFYAALLNVRVESEHFEQFHFSILEHGEGNGGCLVPNAGDVTDKGILVYMNADGRIRDAVEQAKTHGGKVLTDVHSIGPHGFRAVLLDSEGNRIAVHSTIDA